MGVHVVFGAGQVGPTLAELLRAQDREVRLVLRSSRALPDGFEQVRGDALDPAFCVEAARGAEVLYHCMNPPYSARAWATQLPVLQRNLIEAARSAGARLVVLDNLYAIGATGGLPITEDTPPSPVSRKGKIRARLAEDLLAAHGRGDVQAVIGRASDFYGPRGGMTHFGSQFWKPVLAGRPGRVLIDPEAVHTYHYIPDVAAGLAALGTSRPEDAGRAWMLPCRPAVTARTLIARFAEVLGRPIRLARFPAPAVHVLSPFVPFLREINEVLYQWDSPFVVDDGRFRARFGTLPADESEAARATVAWARAAFGQH